MTITTVRAVVAGFLSLGVLFGVEEAVQADGMSSLVRNNEPSAAASVINSQGQIIGVAQFFQTQAGMLVTLSLEKTPEGVYSAYISRTGACSSFGLQRQETDDVALSGMNAGKDGRVRAEILTDAATVQSVRHGSLVVFANDVSGQSRRIACAVIQTI
ncbi:hypothetical protein CCP2SC5_560007 [Azospirillaceae bacterium]